VVNAVGSTVDPRSGELYGVGYGLDDEFGSVGPPSAADVVAWRTAAASRKAPLATTLAVIATDAPLTKAQCSKVSGIGHDGMARAIRPVHTMLDGDTVFTLATESRAAPDVSGFHVMLDAAGDSVSRAVVHAMLAATTVETPAGRILSYRDTFPSTLTSTPT